MVQVSKYTGHPISDFEHMVECVETIVTTPLNTRYYNRGYGTIWFDRIDTPINQRTQLDFYANIIEVLEREEKRLANPSININTDEGLEGKLKIDLTGVYVPENKVIKLEGLRLV